MSELQGISIDSIAKVFNEFHGRFLGQLTSMRCVLIAVPMCRSWASTEFGVVV